VASPSVPLERKVSALGNLRSFPLAGLLICVALVAVGMMRIYHQTGHEIALRIDGQTHRVLTHQASVSGVLKELGVALASEDIVLPGVDAPLAPGDVITIQRAQPIWIEADGETSLHKTHCQTLGELLHEAGIRVQAHDRILLDRREASLDTPLPAASHAGGSVGAEARDPVISRVQVERAVPLVLHDDGIQSTAYTTAKLVGEALWQAGITLYAGDIIRPGLDTEISPGMNVYLLRSKAITIVTDDHTIKTRTRGVTYADALAQEGIHLAGADYSEPALDTPVAEGGRIRIFRIAEEWGSESETISYETLFQADENLEIDHQRIAQRGREGIRKRRFRTMYQNGQEISRVLEKEWIAQEPQARIIVYGTKIVLRDIETPGGVRRYWRHFRVLATSYTAATSGKTRDHPHYGITFMGWRARKGIIAVDPRVIRLASNMYVPGYGLGVAGDTGGKIKGRRIDLCYEEDDLTLWYKWVDVYLLEPVPSRSKIKWILPNWPREG